MSRQTTIHELFDALVEPLSLEWLAGRNSLADILPQASSRHRHHLVVGPLNYIHPNRLQLIGPTEHDYLLALSPDEQAATLLKIFAAEPTAIILTDDLPPIGELVSEAEERGTALIRTPIGNSHVLETLRFYTDKLTARRSTIHGVFLEVLGMGVLVTGKAAIGKSELALELLTRGHRLVADDAPEFSRVAPEAISGTCPPLLKEFLEVRGLGIINVRAMFGDSAIKHNKYLGLIIHLQRMQREELASMDRFSGTYTEREVLGIMVPQVTIPVAPGRNLAIMVETAVRNHMLRLTGYDAAQAFVKNQQQAIKNQG